METSLILARILGILLIVAYGSVLINQRFIYRIWEDLPSQGLGILLAGYLGLVGGLIILQFHNIWAADWRVLITILAWIMAIHGAIRLLFPEFVLRLAQRLVERQSFTWVKVLSGIMFVVGIFLTYVGFAG